MYQAVASSNLAFCAKGNAVVLYLISLVSKSAVKRDNDQPIQLLPLPRSLWQLYDLYKLLKLLYLGVSQW